MLSFAEEIYLLALDDTTGQTLLADGRLTLERALIVAALDELSFMRRLDTDLESLIVLDTSPTCNPVLDAVLEPLRAGGTGVRPLRPCLDDLFDADLHIAKLTCQELVRKQVIRIASGRVFWVLPSRLYPVVDNRELIDVERRLRAIITDHAAIPDARDAVLISLVTACGLFRDILSPRELRRHQQRIDEIARLDLVGRTLIDKLHEVQLAMVSPRLF